VHGASKQGQINRVEAHIMRIVVTFRAIFNLLIIAILIGIVAGVYLWG
jgi:hypothetical protein